MADHIYDSDIFSSTKYQLEKLKLSDSQKLEYELDYESRKLLQYLETHFTYIHKTETNLFIVASNEAPIYTTRKTINPSTAQDIFHYIKVYVEYLIFSDKNILNQNNIELNNFIIVYSSKELFNKVQDTIFTTYKREPIHISNQDMLYFDYYNNTVDLSEPISSMDWLPYVKTGQTSTSEAILQGSSNNVIIYNNIIETLVKLSFVILSRFNDTWDLNIIYNRYIKLDINTEEYSIGDEYYKQKQIHNLSNSIFEEIVTQQYLYQVWLYYNKLKEKIRTDNKNVHTLPLNNINDIDTFIKNHGSTALLLQLLPENNTSDILSNTVDKFIIEAKKMYNIDNLSTNQLNLMKYMYNYEVQGLIPNLDTSNDTFTESMVLQQRFLNQQFHAENTPNIFNKKSPYFWLFSGIIIFSILIIGIIIIIIISKQTGE